MQRLNASVIIFLSILLLACSTGNKLQRDVLGDQFELGMQAYNSKNYINARSIFEELLSQRGEEVKYAEMLALTNQKLGENEKAISQFEEILAVHPNREKSLLGLSRAAMVSGDTLKAVESLEKIANIAPDNTEALRELSLYYWNQKNSKESYKYVQRLLTYAPYDQWAQNLLKQIVEQKEEETKPKEPTINYNNELTLDELEILHKTFGIEKEVHWQSIKMKSSNGKKTIITRRLFFQYLSEVFRVFQGRSDYHSLFQQTETNIKDLKQDDPDYSKILYLTARNLSFEVKEDKIMLNDTVSESEAGELIKRLREQLLQ